VAARRRDGDDGRGNRSDDAGARKDFAGTDDPRGNPYPDAEAENNQEEHCSRDDSSGVHGVTPGFLV
jgi:hypothetical protein